MKKNFILSATAIAIISIALGVFAANQQTKPLNPTDKAVAALLATKLSDSEGKSQALSQWKGKILVVNFWATWCAPCVKEMPELSAFQQEMASKNVQLLGIGIDDAASISAFRKKHPVQYPLFVAGMEGSDLASNLGNDGGALPYTVLIDRDGHVVKSFAGTVKLAELKAQIQKLLTKK